MLRVVVMVSGGGTNLQAIIDRVADGTITNAEIVGVITVGYGTRPTSGYSIKVKALYETENAVYIQTELLGPSKEEKITEKQTYPYVVVKMEWIDKNIIFE